MPLKPKRSFKFGPIAQHHANSLAARVNTTPFVMGVSRSMDGEPRQRLDYDLHRDGRLRSPYYGPGNSQSDVFKTVGPDGLTTGVLKAPEASWRPSNQPRPKKNKRKTKRKKQKKKQTKRT